MVPDGRLIRLSLKDNLMRRAVFASLAIFASTTLIAAPAQAAGDCNVSTPSKVSITSPYKEYKITFSGECTYDNGYGSWDVIHPTQGYQDILIYDAESSAYPKTQYMGFYDWNTPRGKYAVRPGGAWDGDYNDLTQNTRSMTVKLGTRVSLSSARSGSYVTLTAKSTYYSPARSAYRTNPGATVKFYSKKSDGTWAWRKTVTADSYGVAKLKIYSSTAKDWKAVVQETSTKWSRTSSVVRR